MVVPDSYEDESILQQNGSKKEKGIKSTDVIRDMPVLEEESVWVMKSVKEPYANERGLERKKWVIKEDPSKKNGPIGRLMKNLKRWVEEEEKVAREEKEKEAAAQDMEKEAVQPVDEKPISISDAKTEDDGLLHQSPDHLHQVLPAHPQLLLQLAQLHSDLVREVVLVPKLH